MKELKRSRSESWGSRVGLILAMAGNAVGFGNFLRFPVQAVQNGGGAFIIPYLVCLVILGFPLLFVEWSIGRYGGISGHHSSPFMMQSMDKRAFWKYIGVFGIFSNIVIAAYYCYLESWTLSYLFHSVAGTFNGMTQEQVSGFFDHYLGLTGTGISASALFFYLLCLLLNIWILSKGLSGGVEKAAKIGIPLLIVFGVFLAIRGVTLKAGHSGAKFDGFTGLNFLWTPDYKSLLNPKVWLAAAGQIFFTLSVGMGSIHCYASYLKKNDDLALNSMSAGFLNEFVEIVLGGTIIIPIAIGYFGIERVISLVNLGGMGLGFRIMPFLFENWGPVLSAFAGVAFFGLLFFAGITSSLAMGTPVMSFLRDEFSLKRGTSAIGFGLVTLIIGLPTVFFFRQGIFDEYDYWGGTVSLVVFAMLETILFAWFFGLKKGWNEITRGSDIRVPLFFRFLIKYITPVVLIIVFFSALLRPEGDDWSKINLEKWPFHNESIIGQIQHKGNRYNRKYFAGTFYSESGGVIDTVYQDPVHKKIVLKVENNSEQAYNLKLSDKILVTKGQHVAPGDPLWNGKITNPVFYQDMARLLLLILFLILAGMVAYAHRNKIKKARDK